MQSFHVPSGRHHLAWDNTIEPAVTVAPGDEATLELFDSSGGQLAREDDAGAVARLDMAAVNPCTGPVYVDGVQPGDDLVVTLLDVDVRDWAWTANIPNFGLLAEDFPDPLLRISTVRDGVVTLPSGIEVPARPMIGTIGVAPAAPGRTPLLVPTANGGNMDIPQVGAGTVLHLPSAVPGALFSAGDAHAVQGDGEVCGTGAETAATLRLRLDVGPGAATATPWYQHTPRQHADGSVESWTAATGIGPDLFRAAQDATRRAIDLVSAATTLDPVDAYLLLSLVGELRISEIVDAPNWVVSMHVPARFARAA
jgi:acetamidase/formamidase